MKIGISLWMSAVILLATGAQAAYINVPADQPTIQAGIDAAVDGDTVLVSMGTYSGPGNRDIDFKGKKIYVDGFSGPENTIIDCGGTPTEHHGGFIFRSTEDSNSVLNGFTIQNAWYPLNDSGAITCRGGSPVIANCVIRNNLAHGISISSSSAPDMIKLQISSNDGWGIWMPGYPYASRGVQIRQCQIDHNALGGVIVTRVAESTIVTSNTIVENGGIGLFLQGDLPMRTETAVYDSTTIIERNIIAFNAKFGIYMLSFFPGLHYYRNDLFGNESGDWLGNSADTVCNLSADPLFCRQAGFSEYSLAGTSPCLQANNVCGADMGAFGLGCTACCIGMRGNVDCDAGNNVDISDLSRMIDHLYISFDNLCCFEAANVDGAGSIDISDLSQLIDYMYISLNPLGSCP